MYILEAMQAHGRRIRFEFFADDEYTGAERAEAALRRLRQAGISVRVYQLQDGLIRLVAVSGGLR